MTTDRLALLMSRLDALVRVQESVDIDDPCRIPLAGMEQEIRNEIKPHICKGSHTASAITTRCHDCDDVPDSWPTTVNTIGGPALGWMLAAHIPVKRQDI